MRALILLSAFVLAGCSGRSDRVAVAPVRGAVKVGGKPAQGVRVFLVPRSAPGVPDIPANPRGVTGPDGQFSLTTFAADDGAAAGTYQVVLFWPAEVEEGAEESDVDRLNGWYDAAHSQVTATVGDGPTDLPPIEVPSRSKPPAFQEGIPRRN